MTNSNRTISYVLLAGVIISTGYFSRDNWRNFLFPFKPCEKPIEYSLGDFDNRFGISKEVFLAKISEAELVWEEALGKELFTYSENGKMKVHLVYDYRQQTTDRLTAVEGSISADKVEYHTLRIDYDNQKQEYNQKSKEHDQRSEEYDKDLARYDADVEYWNDKGGAPEKEYQVLKVEQERLNTEAEILNKKASELNSLVKKIEETAAEVNDLAKKLNIKVETFNTIGDTTGEEFSEGEYVRDEEGERINVYEFETETELQRLLEHELGHALGLNHVEDPHAIMYQMNSSNNLALTPDDLGELLAICKP